MNSPEEDMWNSEIILMKSKAYGSELKIET